MGRAHFIIALFLLTFTKTSFEIQVCPPGLLGLGNFCYQTIEETTVPFECPFKSTYRYEDSLNFLCLLYFNKYSWMNIKRNEIHGYFEYPELHSRYGYLLVHFHQVPNNNEEDCLMRQGNQALRTASCSEKTAGLCVYHRQDRQFCDAYDRICKVTTKCYCHSNRKISFLCETECDELESPDQDEQDLEEEIDNSEAEVDHGIEEKLEDEVEGEIDNSEPEPEPELDVEENPPPPGGNGDGIQGLNALQEYNNKVSQRNAHLCLICNQRFEMYPQPEITLKFDRIQTIIITVRNLLKLISLSDAFPIHCFSDVYNPDESQIRHRIFSEDLLKLAGDERMRSYLIKIDPPAVGFYWCEGFSLPELAKVTSNKVLAGVSSNFGLNLVLNFTSEEFELLPYDVHTSSISRLHNIIDAGRYQLIRPPEPPILSEDRSKAYLTLHLTTFVEIADAESEYRNLASQLVQCEAAGLKNCSLAFSDLCLPTNTTVDSITASWPKVSLGQPTPPKEILLQENGLPIKRRCAGSFMNGAYWSDVVGKVFTSTGSDVTKPLHDLLNSNKTAEELNRELHAVIYDAVRVIPYDVYLIAQILERIAHSQEYFDLELFIRSVDEVMELDLGVLQLAQIDLNATDIILYSVDLALSAIAGDPKARTIKANNLMALVMGLDGSNQTGFAVYQLGDELSFATLTGVSSKEDVDLQNLRVATFIPANLMRQILEQNAKPNLVAVVYLTDALFRDGGQSKLGVASFALSVYVTGFTGAFLSEQLPIIFDANFEAKGGHFYCAFWEFGIDEMLVAIHGRWLKTGLSDLYNSFKVCGFSHMTHFALLANAPRNPILDLISLIGCVLSMLGVVGIFVTAMAFKSWGDSATTRILLNLSATIFLQMLFLFLWHVNWSKLLCKIISMGLHYVILSQFCWMLLIGYLQYRKLVQVLPGKSPKFLLASYLTCWLLPVLPVIIIYVLYPKSYANQNYCHVYGLGLYFGLLAPIGFVVLINVAIFILIFANLARNKAAAFGHKDSKLRDKIRLCFLLFFLLGFSWVFGLLAHLLKSLALSYLFCVTATLQGFVLYVYFVLCEKSMRKFWAEQLGRCCCCCFRRMREERKKSDTPQITKCNDDSNCGSEDKTRRG